MSAGIHLIATVLIVDDDPDCRALFRDLLEWEHYRVLDASDGRGALDICEVDTPDVILLDAVMPIMDGQELARTLARDVRWIRIPIIVVSGTDCVSDGNVVARLTKPVAGSLLRATIRDALVFASRVCRTAARHRARGQSGRVPAGALG
jgi:CheY-like chemotaxis protein